MELFPELSYLALAQTCERKHADLVGNVVPRAWSAELLEFATKSFPHVDDAARHGAQVLLPLGEQDRVVEHDRGHLGAVNRRVGNLGALQEGELGGHAGGYSRSVGGRSRDIVEAAGAFAIETKVLGEGLGDYELEAELDKEADGRGVTVEVAGSKALVGSIEEGEVALGGHDLGDLAPLGGRRVDAGGVVGTGVEEDDGALGGVREGLLHADEVETLGLLVEVGVLGNGQTDVGEDLVVVGPCWVAEVDGRLLGGIAIRVVEAREEETAEMAGAGAGDGLDGGNAALGDGGSTGAENKLGSFAG